MLDLTVFSRKESALAVTKVSDIWGIGSSYSEFLEKIGIKNALQLRDADSALINRMKRKMGVWGTRIIQELKGIPCYSVEPKQRAHSPPKVRRGGLAAGLASELKIDAIPYGRRFPVA